MGDVREICARPHATLGGRGDWTADAIAERKWLRSLVQSFANNGTTE